MSNATLSKLTGILVAGASAPLFVLVGAGAANAATPVSPAVNRVQPAELQAGAPCVVTGYSLHAQQEMAKDHIGSDHVENVVHDYCHRATWQKSKKTWRYTDRRIVVIANVNGYVVTAWRL
jgi:hypothetical protein